VTPVLHRRAVERLPRPGAADRRWWAEHADPSPSTHARAVAALDVFEAVELRDAPAPTVALDRPLRIVAFNAERGRHLDGCVDLLAGVDPDVVLLSEVDRGMARSDQRDVAHELGSRLDMASAFAVEFVELGPGGPEEAARVGGRANHAGLHGGAVLSRFPVVEVAVLRLELDGLWYGPRPAGVPVEPRIGGRMAVLAVLDTAGGEIVVAAPHLESHGDPAGRADQLAALLDAVDELRPGAPAVIGGDLNTSTLGSGHFAAVDVLAGALDDGPDRFLHPRRWEPLFATAEARGYGWAADRGVATARVARELPPTMTLDWFLTRKVGHGPARVIPAVTADGAVVSDHELIALDDVRVSG
jgi:endonuclease/exonuclease/phosphatase family metal-dependent hydrolase